MSTRVHVPHRDLEAFARELLAAGGVDAGEASVVGEVAAWNDLVGRATQGVVRVPTFLDQVADGAVRTPCRPSFERTAPATGRLDGDSGLGYAVGARAVEEAAALAAEAGVGAVGVHRSNHLGSGAAWAHRLAERGYASLVVSNSFPKVAPPGGTQALLGTNPFAFGAPAPDGRSLLVDFSTAATSGGAVRAAGDDAEAEWFAGETGALRPDGPRGFALAVAVEVLAGVLTGAGVAAHVGSQFARTGREANVGHFVLAIDPGRFVGATAFGERLASLAELLRSAPVEGERGRCPGDVRWAVRSEQLARGIELEASTRESLASRAAGLGVRCPW